MSKSQSMEQGGRAGYGSDGDDVAGAWGGASSHVDQPARNCSDISSYRTLVGDRESGITGN